MRKYGHGPHGGFGATAWNRVIFALVANRALDPMSKHAPATRWVGRKAAIPGLDGVSDDAGRTWNCPSQRTPLAAVRTSVEGLLARLGAGAGGKGREPPSRGRSPR
jgi:hypothetical protein